MDPQEITRLKRLAVYFSDELDERTRLRKEREKEAKSDED